MTTMELRSSLLQEIASIIESDEMTRKTLEYVRKLKTKATSHQSAPPCQYTTEEDESERLLSFPQIGQFESLLQHRTENFRSLVINEHNKLIYT